MTKERHILFSEPTVCARLDGNQNGDLLSEGE
jgi:hypothetical protein